MKIRTFRMILIGCLITSLLFGGTAYAQEEELPEPGITPDSPFYFIDIWGKKIGMFFAFKPEAKAKKALEYAEERLAESLVMAAGNKAKAVKQATDGYDVFLATATEEAGATGRQGISDNMSEVIALATSKHLSALDRVWDSAPEEARPAVTQAKAISMSRRENVLRTLARSQPQRAIEINLSTIEDSLNRVKAKADQNDTGEVTRTLDDTEKLFQFGEEISGIARESGLDDATLEALTSQASSVHLKVLLDIHEKVPTRTQPAIERAMQVSISSHEEAIQSLKKKGILENILEKVAAPFAAPGKFGQMTEQEKIKSEFELREQPASKNIVEEREIKPPVNKIEKPEIESEKLQQLKREPEANLPKTVHELQEQSIEQLEIKIEELERLRRQKIEALENEIAELQKKETVNLEKLNAEIEELETAKKEEIRQLDSKIEKLITEIAKLREAE